MSLYQVSGTQDDGTDFSILILAENSKMGVCWKEKDWGYPTLKRELVSQELIDTADKITGVVKSTSKAPLHVVKIEFNTLSVSKIPCRVLKKAACYAVVALPIIAGVFCKYYMNFDSLRDRFFEQLGRE